MLNIRIVADRDGFAEHLDGLRAEHADRAKTADPKGGERARQQGIAEGIALAAEAFARWEEPEALTDAELHGLAAAPAQRGPFAEARP